MSTTALEDKKILNGDPGGSADGPPLRIEPCGRRVRVERIDRAAEPPAP